MLALSSNFTIKNGSKQVPQLSTSRPIDATETCTLSNPGVSRRPYLLIALLLLIVILLLLLILLLLVVVVISMRVVIAFFF